MVSILFLTILACSSPIRLYTTTGTNAPTFTLPVTVTNAPTDTKIPTITNTPTATPVPTPPVTITGCAFGEDCPEAKLVTSYLEAKLEVNTTTQVVFPYGDKVLLNIGWCTLDEATLEENLQHISYIFEVDGISYLDLATVKHGYSTDDNNPSIQYPCTFIGVMLGGWQISEDHQVTIGYSFDAEVFDGWNTYSPFTDKYIFNLKPTLIPTVTPTSTPTLTSTPGSLPTIPDNTSMPGCEASSSITITNNTGGAVTLYLSGPARYHFYLSTGETILSVCPGTYNYTGYGCEGASVSGTWDAPASHTFLCGGQ
jgi:hypothetical protein